MKIAVRQRGAERVAQAEGEAAGRLRGGLDQRLVVPNTADAANAVDAANAANADVARSYRRQHIDSSGT